MGRSHRGWRSFRWRSPSAWRWAEFVFAACGLESPGVFLKFAALSLPGQIGFKIDARVLQFLRDFALIIFIYSLGLQVGPGFVTSLRAEGLRLNALSVAVLALGALITGATVKLAALEPKSAPGIYAGAFTTTPGLAAGQEALRHKAGDSTALREAAIAPSSLAYSVSYPFGVVGPILVIVLLRRIFRIKLPEERKKLIAEEETRRPPIETFDFEVTDSASAGIALRDHPLLKKNGIVLSRLLRGDLMSVPTGETEIRVGDVYRAVGPRHHLAELVAAIGRPAKADLSHAIGDVQRMDLVVTRTKVLRKSLQELDLIRKYGVTVARLSRSGVDLIPRANLKLTFADNVTVVGPAAGVKHVEHELGNCLDRLNRPQLIPIFLGIVLGVIVGSIPLTLPGLHVTLRIGLAGGPLLAAILLSQLGNLGSVVWYMPVAANGLFRDFGLAVFLACVGLDAGQNLFGRIMNQGGLYYLLWGSMITIVPVFLIACYARMRYKMNFFTLSGWVSGAMTSTTALAFANDLAESDAPAVSYAAVAPVATLVPIICAQLLAIVRI